MDKNTSLLTEALEKALKEHQASGETSPSGAVRVGPHPDALKAGDEKEENK